MQLHDTVEEEGVPVSSYWDKYKVDSYDEALKRAEVMDFCGGIKTSYTDKGDLFNSLEEFDELAKYASYPVIVLPMF